MNDYIATGSRVRLKARAISGWKGTATILVGLKAIKDDHSDADGNTVSACRYQWSVMHDQTPNPEHAVGVARWQVRSVD